MRNTVRGGRRGGLATGAGTLTGLSMWAAAAALGLTALVQASQLGYELLRLAGAAYLIWLGVVSLRARPGALLRAQEHDPAQQRPTVPGGKRLRQMYAMGTLSNVFNPKIGVFFVAFLPGFVPATTPVGPTTALLGLLFVIETGLWLAVLSWLVHRGAGWLRRPRVELTVEGSPGSR